MAKSRSPIDKIIEGFKVPKVDKNLTKLSNAIVKINNTKKYKNTTLPDVGFIFENVKVMLDVSGTKPNPELFRDQPDLAHFVALLFSKFQSILLTLEASAKKCLENEDYVRANYYNDVIAAFKKTLMEKIFPKVLDNDNLRTELKSKLTTTEASSSSSKTQKPPGKRALAHAAVGHYKEKLFGTPKEVDTAAVDTGFLFPNRENNQVIFYSNAYNYSDGNVNHASGAFADMFRDLNNAKHHICITGWALSPFEKFGENQETLPVLLAKKALEGVKIVLLIWNNATPGFDEEIAAFQELVTKEFQKMKITPQQRASAEANFQMALAPHHGKDTHHGKMVIADDTLYIGGLDLTHGRSNPATWHDCHAQVKGPVVADAVSLIRARWYETKKATYYARTNKYEEGMALLNLIQERVRKMTPPASPNSSFSGQPSSNTTATDPDQPTMRFLCTMDNTNADFSEINPAKTIVTDIHQTYCNAISQAENFIYMENQFFTGTRVQCQSAEDDEEEIESKNKIIEMLFEKIKERINSDKPFHFYCQLPFRPEGEKEKGFEVQAVLPKQWRTMSWLIAEVEKILPQGKTVADYITFYNLGCNDSEGKYQMKYTHSKLLIVDDKQLIIGSANCNERSMKGTRDTEVAIHLDGGVKRRKEISDFRNKLMKEHFGRYFYGEPQNTYVAVQTVLDDNLKTLKSNKAPTSTASTISTSAHSTFPPAQAPTNQPMATPWGNIPLSQLYKNEKPEHVPETSWTVQAVNLGVNLGK